MSKNRPRFKSGSPCFSIASLKSDLNSMSFWVLPCLFMECNDNISLMQMSWGPNGNDSGQTFSTGPRALIHMSCCNHYYPPSISNGKVQLDLKQWEGYGDTGWHSWEQWGQDMKTSKLHGRLLALESENSGFKSWIILLTSSSHLFWLRTRRGVTAGQYQWWRKCWFLPFSQKFAAVFCLSSRGITSSENGRSVYGVSAEPVRNRNVAIVLAINLADAQDRIPECFRYWLAELTHISYQSLLVTMEGGASYYRLLPQPSLEGTLLRQILGSVGYNCGVVQS